MNFTNICSLVAATSNTPQLLSVSDFDAVVALQRSIVATVPAGFVRFKAEHELMPYLSGNAGAAFGIVEDDELLAMALVRVPRAENPNVLEPLPRILPIDDWPLHTAILENAMVVREARGRGYQRALLDARIAYAKAVGMRWIGGGARLDNVFSWRNMLASGMVIVGARIHEQHTYVGLLKSIESNDALSVSFKDYRLVATGDKDEHIRALDAGYVGIRLTSFGCVVYQRYLHSSDI